MHELSIARALLAAAQRHVPPRCQVRRVRILVGAVTGVAPEALDFAFQAVTAGTCFEGASLLIDRQRGRSRCRRCASEYEFDGLLGTCPHCGALGGTLLAGEELDLCSIEVTDV